MVMKAFSVALLGIVLVGCGATVSPSPSPSPSAPPEMTASPTVAPSPSPFSVAPMVCGRIDAAHCAQIEAMVQRQFPFALHATAIVADYTCPPGAFCVFGFNAIVSIIVPSDPAVDYAYWPPTYSVRGTSGPERLEPWAGPLPAAFATLLQSMGFMPTGFTR